MSIPDELTMKYFNLITDLSQEEKTEIAEKLEKGDLHPRDAKMHLGKVIVRMYHDEEVAKLAEEHFKTVFQRGAIPEDIPEITWKGEKSIPIIDLLVQLELQSSKSEARRMIQNGGIRINGDKVMEVDLLVGFEKDFIIQVGKRKFLKVIIS